MGASQLVVIIIYSYSDQINENGMGGLCSTHEKNETGTQNSW
jgi:hypothetical protein